MTDIESMKEDDHIAGLALVYAIAQTQSLPLSTEEHYRMMRMCSLARSTFEPADLAGVVAQVEYHTSLAVDMNFPEGEDATAEDEIYENDYECEAVLIRSRRAAYIKDAVAKFPKPGVKKRVSAKDIADAALARAAATQH